MKLHQYIGSPTWTDPRWAYVFIVNKQFKLTSYSGREHLDRNYLGFATYWSIYDRSDVQEILNDDISNNL